MKDGFSPSQVATGRALVLPRTWAACERHWWQLTDCRMPGVESLPLPYEAPLDIACAFAPSQRYSPISPPSHTWPPFCLHPGYPDYSDYHACTPGVVSLPMPYEAPLDVACAAFATATTL